MLNKNCVALYMYVYFFPQYYVCICMMALCTVSLFVRVSSVLKLSVMMTAVIVYNLTLHTLAGDVLTQHDLRLRQAKPGR